MPILALTFWDFELGYLFGSSQCSGLSSLPSSQSWSLSHSQPLEIHLPPVSHWNSSGEQLEEASSRQEETSSMRTCEILFRKLHMTKYLSHPDSPWLRHIAGLHGDTCHHQHTETHPLHSQTLESGIDITFTRPSAP